MAHNAIVTKNNETFIFRKLQVKDSQLLGDFFANLSSDTRSRFGPHPLTHAYAKTLCSHIDFDKVARFIVVNESIIAGYFIVDFTLSRNEKERYASYEVEIEPILDPVFAPCIADKYQNSGLASQAMKYIIAFASEQSIRSLVLMGGTQETNMLARAFYKKFGFVEFGEFHTEMKNIDMKLEIAKTIT